MNVKRLMDLEWAKPEPVFNSWTFAIGPTMKRLRSQEDVGVKQSKGTGAKAEIEWEEDKGIVVGSIQIPKEESTAFSLTGLSLLLSSPELRGADPRSFGKNRHSNQTL
ncbi:hypothetical protein Salat_2911500 [Sesamum alatum]|uniref:Uncharacterized protein n=1 Tax=Sesamum alatum TaxID=300844 RepID=A0AAE1XJ12_9LAMI|nr:hypothetical protein Salat_2911500 [Sesamum alatum]